jgi:hypothetical protein
MVRFLSGITVAVMVMLGSMSAAVASSVADSGKIGTLKLYGKQGGESTTCEIPMNTGSVTFVKNGGRYGCKNDEYYFFRITGGQPGTLVTFMDAGKCNYSEPVYHYLITGGRGDELNMTALSKLEHNASTGEVVEGNLETYGSPKKGRLYGKLSCVSFQKY